MAQFLDKQQDVITVELTKHGRKLLAQGLFNPEFYFFFDNSVVYANKYTGNSSESVNSIQDRILYDSITTKFLNVIDNKEQISDNLLPIGTSDYDRDYAPAWELKLLNGSIKELSPSSSYYKKEITLSDVVYQAKIENNNLANFNMTNNSSFELEDGRAIILDDDYVLIELSEENVGDDFKNFEIEIYTFEELYGGKEKNLKRKLLFTENQNNIIDGIIYDPNELPQNFEQQPISKKDVGFYLDVLVDDEIDQNIIRASEGTIKDQIKPTYKPAIIDVPKEDC